jgi:hypothetical protein
MRNPMSSREGNLAAVRHELRVHLMAEESEGVGDLLASLWRLLSAQPKVDAEARGEYERWKLRFEMLDATT